MSLSHLHDNVHWAKPESEVLGARRLYQTTNSKEGGSVINISTGTDAMPRTLCPTDEETSVFQELSSSQTECLLVGSESCAWVNLRCGNPAKKGREF